MAVEIQETVLNIYAGTKEPREKEIIPLGQSRRYSLPENGHVSTWELISTSRGCDRITHRWTEGKWETTITHLPDKTGKNYDMFSISRGDETLSLTIRAINSLRTDFPFSIK